MNFIRQQIVFIVLLIAIICTIFIGNKKGDIWEENIRTALYALKNDTVPSYATEMVDSIGIPYVYYAPQNNIAAGTKYNPTIVANYALQYYHQIPENKLAEKYFFNCVNFLVNHLTIKENAALYYFNWQQPWYPHVKGKFTSGMTSGRTLDVFTKAFTLTKDSNYLAYAKLLMNGFYISVKDSGFTYQENNGWWYEEIATPNTNTPHILDGHIYAILGLQAYDKLNNNDSTKFLITKGLTALKEKLTFYDAGNGVIFYDNQKAIADKKYQHILTQQMLQLFKNTHDSTYWHYYEKWNAPLKRDYTLKVFTEKNISGILLQLLIFSCRFSILWFIQKILLAKK